MSDEEFSECEIILLIEGLSLADDEVCNRIATCPDVVEYALEIAEYEEIRLKLQNLTFKVTKLNF